MGSPRHSSRDEGIRAQVREALPSSRWARLGLLLILVGVVAFLLVVFAGVGLEDTGPLFAILFAAGCVFVGLVCSGTAVIVKLTHRLPPADGHEREDIQ